MQAQDCEAIDKELSLLEAVRLSHFTQHLSAHHGCVVRSFCRPADQEILICGCKLADHIWYQSWPGRMCMLHLLTLTTAQMMINFLVSAYLLNCGPFKCQHSSMHEFNANVFAGNG